MTSQGLRERTATPIDGEHGLEAVAERFWVGAGKPPSYPCDLRRDILWTLPLWVKDVPHLSTRTANLWAANSRIPYSFAGRDRPLRGCLLAYRDNGVILLDSEDPTDEQLFTLAHELAHFLLDYEAPRRRALAALGEGVRPVLDGQRPPTLDERVHAALERAPLGVMRHLMERPEKGLPTGDVLYIEDRADRLALEILAPASLVLSSLKEPASPRPYSEKLAYLSSLLISQYGLPAALAGEYASYLLARQGRPTFADWLAGTDM